MSHLNFQNSVTSYNIFSPFVAHIYLPEVWLKVWSNIKPPNSFGAHESRCPNEIRVCLLYKVLRQKHGVQRWLWQHWWQMASTSSVVDPAWINYSPFVHKKLGDVPTSMYHHLLSYSYMTHLHICAAATLAWTCLHNPGTKALNTMPESCFNNSNNVFIPLYRQDVDHCLQWYLG